MVDFYVFHNATSALLHFYYTIDGWVKWREWISVHVCVCDNKEYLTLPILPRMTVNLLLSYIIISSLFDCLLWCLHKLWTTFSRGLPTVILQFCVLPFSYTEAFHSSTSQYTWPIDTQTSVHLYRCNARRDIIWNGYKYWIWICGGKKSLSFSYTKQAWIHNDWSLNVYLHIYYSCFIFFSTSFVLLSSTRLVSLSIAVQQEALCLSLLAKWYCTSV